MPAAYPTLIAAISDPGQFLSTNSHTSMHLSLDDEIVAIETELGTNPSAAHSTVATRLDFEATGHVAALPTAAANTNRKVFLTTDRTGHRSNGTSWIQTEGPPLYFSGTKIGINRTAAPVTLHVQEFGSTGEPAALGSEVARFVRLSAPGVHASASIIGDRTASSSLYLGDQDSVSAGQIQHDHTDNSLKLYSNDLLHMWCQADGATIIARDQTTPGPAMNAATVARFIRAPAAGSHAVVEVIAGISGVSHLRLGNTTTPDVARLVYDHTANTMEFYGNNSRFMYADSSRVYVTATAGSTVTGALAGSALVVARNHDSAAGAGISVVGGALASQWVTLGTNGNPNGTQLIHDAATSEFAVKVNDAGTLKNVFRSISQFTRISTTSFDNAIEISPLGRIVTPGIYAESTASAANVNVAVTGLLARSTSRQADKTDVTPLTLTEALNIAQGVQPISYRSTLDADPADRIYIGATAEDVAKVDPRMAVFTVDDTGHDHWDNPRKRKPEYLYYDRFGLIACQIVADHDTKIGDLADLCLIQQSELQELRDRIAALETVA